MNNNETGHGINVSNLEIIINTVTNYGEAYNPVKEFLQRPYLENLLVAAKDAMTNVKNAKEVYDTAVDVRESIFKLLPTYFTRIGNALKTCDVSEETIKTVQIILRKLQGRRASKYLSDEEVKALAAEGKEITQHSSSQMSFDHRIENMEELMIKLANINKYIPNEIDLQSAAINSMYENMKNANSAVIDAYNKLTIARNQRQRILYDSKTGAVPIALQVKEYVKAVFGASSVESKEVASIAFKNFK